jgi:hypothetical protein
MAKKTQIQAFREAARRLEADESEEGFDSALSKIARHKPRSAEKASAGARKEPPAAPPASRKE